MSWESLKVKPLKINELRISRSEALKSPELSVAQSDSTRPHQLRVSQGEAWEAPCAENCSKCSLRTSMSWGSFKVLPKGLSARISQSELPAALRAENLSKRSPLRLRISESESPRVLISWESLEVKPVRPHKLKISGGEAPEVLWAENLSKSYPRN